MARSKRTSANLESGRQRLAGLKSITPLPDYGASLKLTDYEADIKAMSDKIDSHNQLLSDLDQSQNELEVMEKAFGEKNVRMLAATKAQYGPDSTEYEQVGGTRRSDRKRPVSKKPKPRSLERLAKCARAGLIGSSLISSNAVIPTGTVAFPMGIVFGDDRWTCAHFRSVELILTCSRIKRGV
jgi:hypothetical protein